MRRNGKVVVGLIIVLLLGLLIFSSGHFLSFYNYNQCTSLSNVYCAPQVGGAVTSLSQVSIGSNYGNLSGTFWLVNFILNGQGQYLFSSSSQQIASAINSSYQVKNNQQISINAKLNYQKLVIPYTNSGNGIYMLEAEPIDFAFGWFSQGAGLGTLYTQVNQTANSNTYAFAVSGIYADTDEAKIFNAYSSECSSYGGYTFVQTMSETIGGFNVVQGYGLSCYGVTSTEVASIFTPGSPEIAENVSITYNNGTTSHTFYLTNTQPEQGYGNIALAQIVGYEVGSLNTYIGTTAPLLLGFTNGTQEVINPVSLTTLQQLNNFNPAWLQPAGIEVNNVPFDNLYSFSAFQNGINYQNQQVNQLLSKQNLQPTNPYYGGTIIGRYTAMINNAYNGAPFYYVVDVTGNPVLYPDIQFLVSAQSLGIFVPVAYPKIISESPNPIIVRSGSSNSSTFLISNNASIQGSAYIIITASNGTIVGQSPDFSIPADGTTTESVIISLYNPDLANLKVPLTATVYSAENTNIHNSYTFYAIILPNCPPGMVYFNNTNCKSEVNNCQPGYYWNGTSCHLLCSPPSIFNATTQSCQVPPQPNNQNGIGVGWYVLAIILIIVGAYALMRKGRGGVEVAPTPRVRYSIS